MIDEVLRSSLTTVPGRSAARSRRLPRRAEVVYARRTRAALHVDDDCSPYPRLDRNLVPRCSRCGPWLSSWIETSCRREGVEDVARAVSDRR